MSWPTQTARSEAPSGLVAPAGEWLARCGRDDRDGRVEVVAADIDDSRGC